MATRKLAYIFLVSLCLFLCASAAVVFAQDATTTEGAPSATPLVAPTSETPPPAPDVQARKEMRKVEFRTRVAPLIKNRTKNLLENITNRLTAATSRLERISDRIESRIQKMEAVGRDGGDMRAHLSRARESVSRAKAGLARITDARVDTIVDSENPRTAFGVLQSELFEIAQELTEARAALTQILILMSQPERTATTSTLAE